jgi:site-specific recombinase XerD
MADATTDLATLSPAIPAALAADVEAVRRYAGRALAARTVQTYDEQWRYFAAWCAARGVEALPASPVTLAAYLAARADEGRTASTIAVSVAAVRRAHSLAGLASPAAHPVVEATLAGVRRTVGTRPRQVAAAERDDVRAMVAALDASSSRGLGPKRDRALLLVGFAAALRRTELVALDVADVTFAPEGMLVLVRRSKTDQTAEGRTLAIRFGAHPETCPVRALRAWLDAAGITEGAVFRSTRNHSTLGPRLTGAMVARIVKGAALAAGLDATRYSGHSLRAGWATSAAKAGVDDRAIMDRGRWTSRATVDRYVRRATAFEASPDALVDL